MLSVTYGFVTASVIEHNFRQAKIICVNRICEYKIPKPKRIKALPDEYERSYEGEVT